GACRGAGRALRLSSKGPSPWQWDPATSEDRDHLRCDMRTVIVFESHWGNTEAIARAIADGYGPEAQVLTTDQATPTAIADAALIVAGAPVLAFSLPSERMVEGLASERGAPTPPATSSTPMRTWL